MNELRVTARFKIHEGKLDPFKSLARACVESVREKDTGTLQYDWFFNSSQTECVVQERYEDSDALLQHIGNLGDLLGSFLGISDLSVELYGAPSEELLQATAAIDTTVYSFDQGI